MALDWIRLLDIAIGAMFTGIGTSLGIYVSTRYIVGNLERFKMNEKRSRKAGDSDKET